jgi:hypothetical protein
MAFLPGGGPDAPDAPFGSEEALQARKDQFAKLWGQCALPDGTLVPCQRGLLTQLGELQLGSVGFWLRKRYQSADAFLPPTFDTDPSFFALRSTDLPRTQLSLMRLMQGAYPGLDSATLARHIEVRAQSEETMYPNHYFCPRLQELYIEACHVLHQQEKGSPAAAYREIAESPSAQSLRSRFAQAFRAPPEADLGTWVVIGDELKCRQGEGLSMEPGITQAMSDEANRLAEQTFWHIMRGGSPVEHSALKPTSPSRAHELFSVPKHPREAEVVKLGMGRMLAEIFQGLDRVKQMHETNPGGAVAAAAPKTTSVPQSSPPRCLVFSGHDTTVGPLLGALHATHSLAMSSAPDAEPAWPVFASNIVFELLEATEAPANADADSPAQSGKIGKLPKHLSLHDSLAPLPPQTTDDDTHHLPPQKDEDTVVPDSKCTHQQQQQQRAGQTTTKKAGSTPSSSSRWFLRLLVDQREVALVPYESYQTLRDAYAIRDWKKECVKHRKEDLPKHQW